jgi:hypothetical protein
MQGFRLKRKDTKLSSYIPNKYEGSYQQNARKRVEKRGITLHDPWFAV